MNIPFEPSVSFPVKPPISAPDIAHAQRTRTDRTQNSVSDRGSLYGYLFIGNKHIKYVCELEGKCWLFVSSFSKAASLALIIRGRRSKAFLSPKIRGGEMGKESGIKPHVSSEGPVIIS